MPDGIGAGTIWAALALRLEQLFQNAQQAQQLMQQLDANMQAAATKASAAASTAAATHAKGVAQAVQQAAVIQQQAAEQALRVEMSQWKMRIAATAQGAAEQKAILQQYYNWLQTQAAMPGIRPGTLASLNNEIASVTRQINNLGKETQTVGQGIEATFGRMQRTLAAIVGVEVFRYLTTALTQLPQLAFQTEAGFRILERQAQATGQSIDGVHASMERLASDLRTAKEALAQPVAELMRYGFTVQQIEDIFRGAAASGLLMGKTIDQSIRLASEALISQRSVLLNEIGIVENLDTAFTQYAKSLGKTSDELTAAERAHAAWVMMVRATTNEVRDLPILMEGYGGATAEAGLATYRLQKAVGDALLPVMTELKMAFASIIEATTPLLSTLASLTDDAIPALVAVISYRLVTALTALSAKLVEAAAKGTLFQTAINPIAGVIAAVAAGLVYFGIKAAAAGKSAGDYYSQGIKAAQASYDQSQKLRTLIREYETLAGKPDKSKEEHARLKQVMEDIIRIQPDIAKGYDDIGAAIDRNLETVKSFADELERQSTTKIYALANEFEAITKPRLEAQNAQLEAEQKRLTNENDRKLAENARLARLAGEAKLLILQMNTAKSQGDLKAVSDLQKKLADVLREWNSGISLMGSQTPWGAYVQQLSDQAAKAVNAQSAVSNRLDEIDAQLKANNLELEKGNLLLQARDRIAKGLTPFPESAGGGKTQLPEVGGGKGKEKSPLQQWRDDTEHFRSAIELAKGGYGDLDKALIAYRDNLRKTAADEKVTSEVRAAAAKELQTTLHDLVQWRLDWFERAKADNDSMVGSYEEQIVFLERLIGKEDELQMLAEDRIAVQERLWETRNALFESEVRKQGWSAQQQVEQYQKVVAAHAVSFEQRQEAETKLADLTARASDEAYKAASESYELLTRHTELTAAQRQAIYQREVVDKLAGVKLSADAEKAIALQVLDLQAAVSQERVKIADQTRDLEIDAIELAGEKVEAEIQRELQARDEALRQVGLSEYQKTLIVDNSEKRIQEIRRKAAEDEANELEQWTDSYFQHEIEMGRATTQNWANALREVRRINEQRGIFSEELTSKIERLEKEAADEAAKANQEKLASTIETENARLQVVMNRIGESRLAEEYASKQQLNKDLLAIAEKDKQLAEMALSSPYSLKNDPLIAAAEALMATGKSYPLIEAAMSAHTKRMADIERDYSSQIIEITKQLNIEVAELQDESLEDRLKRLGDAKDDELKKLRASTGRAGMSNEEFKQTIEPLVDDKYVLTAQNIAKEYVQKQIEAFGSLEKSSIEAARKQLKAWQDYYKGLGTAGELALTELAKFSKQIDDEEQRRAEEREQWLVSTGQKAQEVSLLEAVTEAQKKLDEARKAGVGIAEAQQALEKANFDQMRSSIDTAHAYYQFMHQTGKLTDEEFLGRIRDLIDEEMNLMGVRVMNSDTYRQLKSEELQLLQNIRAAEADANIERLQAHEDTTEALLVELQTLERNRDAAKALGTEGAVAAEKYGQAIKRVTGEFASLNQSALQTLKQLQEVVTSAGETDHQRWYRQVNEQISVYQKAAWDRINAMKAEKRTQEEINAEIVKWGTLIGQFTDQQIAARNKVLSGDFWPQLQQNMLGTMLGPLSGLFSSAVDAFKRTNFYTVADSEEQRSRIADALKPLITELSNAVGRRLGVPGAEEGNAQWEVWLQDTLQAGREAFAALWKRAPEWLQDAGSAVTGWIGKVFSGIKDGPIGKALGAAAGPLAAIFLELVKAAEPLKPVWDAMGKVFKLLADIVGMMILPIFKALWPVIKAFGWALAEVGIIIGSVWNALLDLVSMLPFVDLSAYKMDVASMKEARDKIADMEFPDPDDPKYKDKDKGRAGTQVMNMTGESRQVFVELLRPLTNLNALPGLFDNLLARLDTVIETLKGLQSMVLEIPEATINIMRATVTIQTAEAVYINGRSTGGTDLGLGAAGAARAGV